MNRWGEGTVDDLRDIADLVGRRLAKAERYAVAQPEPRLAAAERRIDVPLAVTDKRTIEREAAAFAKTYAQFPGAARFAADWKERALAAAPVLRQVARSFANVPVQALAIGGLKIAALPGEFFSEIGLEAAGRRMTPLMPVGYANGNIGYIPTDRDFRDRPITPAIARRCSTSFSRSRPGVERTFLRDGRKALAVDDMRHRCRMSAHGMDLSGPGRRRIRGHELRHEARQSQGPFLARADRGPLRLGGSAVLGRPRRLGKADLRRRRWSSCSPSAAASAAPWPISSS